MTLNKKTLYSSALLLSLLSVLGTALLMPSPRPTPATPRHTLATTQPPAPASLQRAWNTVRLMLR